MKTFSLDAVLRSAWANFSKHTWFFIGLAALVLGVSFVGQYITNEAESAGSNITSLLTLIVTLISVVLGIWTTKVSIETVDGQTPTFSNIVPSWEVFWKYLLSSLLAGIIVFIPIAIGVLAVGMAFLSQFYGDATHITAASFSIVGVIVGLLFFLFSIYLSIRLIFAQYFVVDKNVGPIDSVRKSFVATKNSFWQLFLFIIAIVLLNILGAIALVVGLLVTLPLTILATAYIYRELGGDAPVPVPGVETLGAKGAGIVPPTPDL